MPPREPIFTDRQVPIVRTHLQRAQLVELLIPGPCIGIQQKFSRGLESSTMPLIERKLPLRQKTAHIPVAAIKIGQRAVIRLLPRPHLLIQLALQAGCRRQLRLGIRILGLQVAENLRILPAVITQPIIGVQATITMQCQQGVMSGG